MRRVILFILTTILLSLTIAYGIINNYFVGIYQTYHYVLFGVTVAFMVSIAMFVNYRRAQKVKTLKTRLQAWSSLSYFVNRVGDEAFTTLPIGIIIYEKDTLTVKWGNEFATRIFQQNNIEEESLEYLHEDFGDLINSTESTTTFEIETKKYDVFNSKVNQALYLFDVTEREELKQKYIDHQPALGILYLDNVEEALQSYDVYERNNIKGEYLAVINDWTAKYKGFLKQFADDKLVVVFHHEQLKLMMEERFEVITKIREISSKHRIRVSASLGIASWNVDYDELNTLAQNAIELAEKRGGDQAVINIQNEKIAYFGGKTDASEKSSRVQVRVKTQNFKELIESSDNVLIVAHQQFDIDALGAMIGVSKMVEASGITYRIVADEQEMDETVSRIMIDLKKENPKSYQAMVTTNEALRHLDDDTLLVVVDTQSPRIIASPILLEHATKIAVIDHHRHGEETFEAQFMYVEPYASSSVELVAEMMEFYQLEIEIEPIEASIMYGGILVDTNEFLYRTGTRTFGAAAYLKEFEASNSQVKEWLRVSKNKMLELNSLLSKVQTVTEGFGVVIDDTNKIRDRVTIAKVSEKILEIDGYSGGFTIARIAENSVGISARSFGSINVQVIMEELGGGGHLNSAATQIKNKTVKEVYDLLKSVLIREMDEGGETVKVILLETIKTKGEKEDVIDVPNGYGQYLISTKKAILATPEALKELEEKQALELEMKEQHLELMKKLKEEIETKSVNVFIKIGQDGKLYGRVTPKMVQEAFKEQNGIQFDRKKLELTSEINSIGIYTATVSLSPEIKAQFEINVLEE